MVVGAVYAAKPERNYLTRRPKSPPNRKQQDANSLLATDDNMEVAISLALARQRDELETVVTRAITDTVESVSSSPQENGGRIIFQDKR